MQPESNRTEQNIYKLLGIEIFKKYMPLSGDIRMRQLYREGMPPRVTKNIKTINQAIYDTKYLAIGHGLVFTVGSILSINMAENGDYANALATETINIVANLYSVILQRYNWIRLSNVKNRMEQNHLGGNDE